MFFSKRSTRFISGIIASNLFLVLVLELCAFGVNAASKMASENYEDNEFAEFEEFDDEEIGEDERSKMGNQGPGPGSPSENDKMRKSSDSDPNDDGSVTVEDEEEEEDEDFDHMKDSEEFELNEDSVDENRRSGKKSDGLKITKVPLHLRSNWESYYLEFLMIAGLVVYFLNFITGRNKNQKIANSWLDSHRELLEANFSLVGDDGKKEIEYSGFIKEMENVFVLWCSGRAGVEGMLIELRLIKRQDLVNTISRLMKPSVDQIIVKAHLNADAMDSFVFCIANKTTAQRMVKEMQDIGTYCPEKKSPAKYGVSDDFLLMNEIGEAAAVLFDAKVVSLLKKHSHLIDFIHISDQYSGPKAPEETTVVKLPEVKKTMVFGFNCPTQGEDSMESMKPMMQLVFYFLEKVRRFRLSKEAKMKADKNRQRVEEIFLKATHNQRQEAAQAKREERRRVEKEKMLNEEDEEKQKKWEDREYRRNLKKKTPKMKQLKVKAM